MQLGQGALLAKTDIKAAYRLVPVAPQDRIFLSMKFNELVYVDGALPFGLRSAPKLFNGLADALEWCIHKQGVDFIHHYLNDFVVAGPPDSEICLKHLHMLERECRIFGVPLAPEKREGPSSTITFLGITINTYKSELRLPANKLERLLQMTSEWLTSCSCTRRELELLIGVLQHACKVIRPGWTFLRLAIALLCVAKQPRHHIRINKEFCSDLMWWSVFGFHWNGAALLTKPHTANLFIVTSDASGSWGWGGMVRVSVVSIVMGCSHSPQANCRQRNDPNYYHSCNMGPLMERQHCPGTLWQCSSSCGG